jgi:hypothetical protein
MVAVFAIVSPVGHACRFRSRTSIKDGVPLNNDRCCDQQAKKMGSSADGTATHDNRIVEYPASTTCSVEAGAEWLSVTENSPGRAMISDT